ncbi:MAG: putative lipopolysaccharide heptosyltransferase III [Sulfuricellaceae bacterium]|nr:putative lipopolysaccharide heptosyltransferase III [Sulfuricellaceae bacterium]
MLNDAIELSSLRRVLVVKLRHHGDVLLTSPVFAVLKNHAPHLEIDALVYKDTVEMLSLHPAISLIHHVDRGWKRQGVFHQAQAEWALLRSLRARNYDLVIHLTEHNRGAWLTRLLASRYGVARKMPNRGRFWRNSFTHLYPLAGGNRRHTVEIHLDALRRIGLYAAESERKLVLVSGDAAEASIQSKLAAAGLASRGFIHLHPASRWLFKCWPAEQVTSLIRALQRLGHRIVITAAPDPVELAWVRKILLPLDEPVVDFSGQLSLKELAALCAQATLFVGMDSVPMHIAAAMNTPVVALFGPSGEREWGPWQVAQRLLVSGHACRPCGNDGCGGGKISECLTDISVDRVLAAIEELLKSR